MSQVCQSKSNYPLEFGYATGSLLNKESVVVCGGSKAYYTSDCYILGENMEWTIWRNMRTKKDSHASIVTEKGIWVTGGWSGGDGGDAFTTTEFLTSSSVSEGVNLPEARNGHCIVKDGEKIFIIGGYDGANTKTSVWQFDASNDFSQTDAKSMNHEREFHACGIFQSPAHSGRPVIVAAGSLYGDGMDSSEFWDYTQTGSKWQLTEKLPVRMDKEPDMSTTSSGDGLIMTQEKGIYSFKCTSENNCSWTKEQQELQISRTAHVMLTVPSALMKNC